MATVYELERLVTRLTGDASGLLRALNQGEAAINRYNNLTNQTHVRAMANSEAQIRAAERQMTLARGQINVLQAMMRAEESRIAVAERLIVTSTDPRIVANAISSAAAARARIMVNEARLGVAQDRIRMAQGQIAAAQAQMVTAEAAITNTGGILTRLSTIGQGMAGVFVALGSVALAGVGIAAIRISAQMEFLEQSFRGLIGSAETASTVLTELKQVALTTPFVYPDLINAAVELSAFGRSAEEIIPDLRMIGDISRGDATRFKEMVYIYGKIVEQGRLYQRDINQLAIRGVPVYLELAKSLGMIADNAKKVPKEVMVQLREQVRAGGIDSSMIEDMFKRITAPGGLFHGQTEKAMNTVKGLLSNVHEQAYLLMRDIGDTITQGLNLKPLLREIGAVTQAFNLWLTSLSSETREAIRVVIAVTAAFIVLAATVTAALIVWNLLTGNVLLIIGLIGGLIAATSAWVIKTGGMEEAWLKIKRAASDFWDFVRPILPWLSIALIAINPPLGLVIAGSALLARNWDEVKQAVEEFYDFIRPTLTATWSLIKTVGFALRDSLVYGWDSIVRAAGGAVAYLSRMWEQLGGSQINWTIAKEGIRDFVLFIEYGFLHAERVVQLAWELIKYGAIIAIDEIHKNLLTVPIVLIGAFVFMAKMVFDVFYKLFVGLVELIGEAIKTIWESILSGEVLNLADRLNKKIAEGTLNALRATVKEVNVFAEGIRKAVGKVEINTINMGGFDIPVGVKVEGLTKLRAESQKSVLEAMEGVNEGFAQFKASRLIAFVAQDAMDVIDVVLRKLVIPFMFAQEKVEELGKAGVTAGEQIQGAFQRVDATIYGSAEAISRLAEYTRNLPTQMQMSLGTAPKPLQVEHVINQRNEMDGNILDVLKMIDGHIIEGNAKASNTGIKAPGLGI